MTTIAQLAAYLATLPQDAEVEVLREHDGNWSVYTGFEELDMCEYSNNMEYSEHTKTLYLGRN